MNTNPLLSWRCRPSPSMLLAAAYLAVWNIAALPAPGAEARLFRRSVRYARRDSGFGDDSRPSGQPRTFKQVG